MSRVYLSYICLFVCLVLTNFTAAHAAINDDDEKILLPAFMQEQEIEFVFEGRRTSYHCDFVRAETMALLNSLGATEIEVECRGGLPNNNRNLVTARFVSVRQTTSDKSTRMATMTPVIHSVNSACDIRDAIVQNVLMGFDTFEYAETGACRGARGSMTYQFKTLL